MRQLWAHPYETATSAGLHRVGGGDWQNQGESQQPPDRNLGSGRSWGWEEARQVRMQHPPAHAKAGTEGRACQAAPLHR